MTDNIFLALENYLATPTNEAAKQVSVISDRLVNDARNRALIRICRNSWGEIEELDKQIAEEVKRVVEKKMPDISVEVSQWRENLREMQQKLEEGQETQENITELEEKITKLKKKITDLNEKMENLYLNKDPVMENVAALIRKQSTLEDKIKSGNIQLGGDEYMLDLFNLVGEQAVEAFSGESTRFVFNEGEVTDGDPQYIFKLSQAEQKRILSLIKKAMRNAISFGYSPHGLVFAFNAYIERRQAPEKYQTRLTNAQEAVDKAELPGVLDAAKKSLDRVQQEKLQFSNLQYCDEAEAAVRHHNTLLRLKIEDLRRRGKGRAANALQVAHDKIKELCKKYPSNAQNMEDFKKQLSAPLIVAKGSSIIKAQRGMRGFLTNFLLVISLVGIGYLAKTAKQRGSFFYKPETDTERKLGNMIKEINQEKLGKQQPNGSPPELIDYGSEEFNSDEVPPSPTGSKQ